MLVPQYALSCDVFDGGDPQTAGGRIVLQIPDGVNAAVYAVDQAGGPLQPLSAPDRYAYGPRLSPGGDAVLWSEIDGASSHTLLASEADVQALS